MTLEDPPCNFSAVTIPFSRHPITTFCGGTVELVIVTNGYIFSGIKRYGSCFFPGHSQVPPDSHMTCVCTWHCVCIPLFLLLLSPFCPSKVEIQL